MIIIRIASAFSCCVFFFSSRRRHTRFDCDWSSDVCSSDLVLEECLLEMAGYLHAKTGEENLCMAGGVALNCVANGKIARHSPFKRLFVQPAEIGRASCRERV